MWFFNKTKADTDALQMPSLENDIHSHLLAGLDDGSVSIDESLLMIEALMNLGYKKFVVTPHIIQGVFDNNAQTISTAVTQLQESVRQKKLDIQIASAAEYYFDNYFISLINTKSDLLCFGKAKYVLFELPVMSLPAQLHHIVFALHTNGYTPVLAHPERYNFLSQTPKLAYSWIEMGLLFQINLMSLTGHYSRQSKVTAEWLIDQKTVHFAGSDCHRPAHLEVIKKAKQTTYYKKLLDLPLLNKSLFDI